RGYQRLADERAARTTLGRIVLGLVRTGRGARPSIGRGRRPNSSASLHAGFCGWVYGHRLPLYRHHRYDRVHETSKELLYLTESLTISINKGAQLCLRKTAARNEAKRVF